MKRQPLSNDTNSRHTGQEQEMNLQRTFTMARSGPASENGIWPRAPWMIALVLLGLLLSGCASTDENNLSALHYFQRGNAAFQAEDYRRAIVHYNRAVEFDDSAPELHYNLGLAYYRVRSFDQAVEAYKAAIEMDPGFADAHHNLALAYNKEYNLAAANRHFNLYRDLTVQPVAANAAQPGPGRGGKSVV